jgi:hypothetical protein
MILNLTHLNAKRAIATSATSPDYSNALFVTPLLFSVRHTGRHGGPIADNEN